jgi:hypothetical protein
MSNSSNLVLPYLAVGQAQKHVTVNETIRKLDAIVQLAVISATIATQPGAPADGAVYILPAGKSGDQWAAFADGSLGYYRDGAWVEITPREGWLAYVKDEDRLLAHDGSAWTLLATLDPRAQCAALGAWHVLGASAAGAPHTGDTSETVLAAITLPGRAMGPNGVLRITTLWSYTNSANGKTLRVRLGGLSGAILQAIAVSATNIGVAQRTIQNRNSESAQIGFNIASTNSFTTVGSGSPPATASVDTSTDQDIVITGQLANAGETVTLEACLVELAYGA